jgi:hypothetical protein
LTSHLGDSGKNQQAPRRMRRGRIWKAMGKRQMIAALPLSMKERPLGWG